MDKYEISLWEDFSDIASNGKSFLNERKIAVIGSDTMKAQARALEPNLVEEINGTNTFTFKMFYTYVDNQTGEKYNNPFQKYLVNERKVKVLWKNKWYDFVIKKCQEDSSKKSVTYTCKDLFINELSKQGYSLTFDTELQNNIGTAQELAEKVLEGSTWQYDSQFSTPIIQRTEGPVYETLVLKDFTSIKQSPNGDISVLMLTGRKILVFYDSLINLLNITTPTNASVQFIYADEYQTDVNDMVVINGDCYIADFLFTKNNNLLTASSSGNNIFSINLALGVSEHYRANRLVHSQRTEYDPLLGRYVLLCKDSQQNDVYEVATAEYTNPLAIINLVANPNNFTGTSGWIGQTDYFGIYPKFGRDTNLNTYEAKSYLRIKSGWTYNTGIQSNISYFTPNEAEKKKGRVGGIQLGEKYVFRIKLKDETHDSNDELIPYNYITNTSQIEPNIFQYDPATHEKISNNGIFYYNNEDISIVDNWIEYTLHCQLPISLNDLNNYGLFINLKQNCWIEDAQFFKYEEGATSYDENAEISRINPGEINLQSIVVPVYKYYYKGAASTVEDLTYLYTGEEESPNYTPVYNNYEKIATISEKESNRFNILQSIAESFSAWVKFRIDHESDGKISVINGVPQKFVYFVEDVGKETGLSFEYGIDLKTITRSIDSDNLATKIIIKSNNNEFANNGFCAISRSSENYTLENFILNLDYFVQHNIIDKEELNKDLYSTSSNYIGYYYYLHLFNSEYDKLTEEMLAKNLDLIRQTSQQKIYEQYITAAQQQLNQIESDLINLADVSQWDEVEVYAKAHINNDKVQALLNAHGEVENQISQYQTSLLDINNSISLLQNFINDATTRQSELIELLTAKHKEFNDKYANYIMEGTWQDENYIDDNKYYLDGLKVAYTSSRPQLSYTINVLRLSALEEFSSKIFNLGDICYIQDKEFFGYLSDKITPYKEKILVSKISSFFDSPEKDVLTIQNYKTRFDDLFQRIAATSQNLEYKEGSFTRAADTINPNGTINFEILQETFDANSNLVLNSSNQDVVWDDTGITVTDKFNSGNKTKILAGGIFISNDGGVTWKNAIRGDGISTDLLTAGRINTSEIYIYDGNAPSFRWDSYGLTAYSYDNNGVNFNKFVRYDKFGFYGYEGSEDFVPQSEDAVWDVANFGLTWRGFFLKSGDSESVFEISTENDLIIKQKVGSSFIPRVRIGRLGNNVFGMQLANKDGETVFIADTNSEVVQIGGWLVNQDGLYHTTDQVEIYLNNQGISGEYHNGDILRAWSIGGENGLQVYQGGIAIGPDGFVCWPWTFNTDGFSYNNEVLKGGIVDQGTIKNGNTVIWNYIKYTNQTFQAWGTQTYSSVSAENTINNWNYTRVYITPPPFATSTQSATANARWGTGVAWANVRSLSPSTLEVIIFGNQDNERLYVWYQIWGTY